MAILKSTNMGPVVQLISNGLGKFVNKVVERAECTEKNSEPTEFVESSETMESADSFKTAEFSASSTQKESAKDPEVQIATQESAQCLVPGESIGNIECVPSKHIEPSSSDQVMQLPDFLKTVVPPSSEIDPVMLNIAGAPETVNEVAKTLNGLKKSIGNQNNAPQFCVTVVTTRYCQTEDQTAESGVMKSTDKTSALESGGVIVKYAEMKDSTDLSQRPKFAESAVQTMEVDEELMPIQPAKKSKETHRADSAKVVVSESVTSSVVLESDDTFGTADSSGTLASPECAEKVDSPSSSESWTSIKSAPMMVPQAHSLESLSAEAVGKDNYVESTAGESSSKIIEKNCSEVSVEKNCEDFTELTPVKNPAEQITAVELSSKSFTLEENLLQDDVNYLYEHLNWFDTNAFAITFDGLDNDQPSVTNYGDVSSTNPSVGGDFRSNPTKHTNFDPDLMTELLRAIDGVSESEAAQCKEPAKEHCKRPMTEQCKERVTEQCKEPVMVKPNYPRVVVKSPDSTGDGLQLHVLPCNVIVPRMENKFPEYAHLVRRAIKRKKELSEDSALKKKFRTEINQKIPLGSFRPNNSKPVSQLQRPERNERIGNDFSSSGFKKLKSKQNKRSREFESVKKKSNPVELVATFVIPPKPDFSKYRIPKLKIGPAKTIDGRKENILQRPEASKRKSSDASDDRGTPLCPKNSKVSPKRRDSSAKAEANLKYSKPKDQSSISKCVDSTDSSKAFGAKNKSSSPRKNESKSLITEKPLQTRSQSHSAKVREDVPQSDTRILPGMPQLSPREPLDFDVVRSQQQTNERTSTTIPVENDKVIHDISKLLSQAVYSYINTPERRENLPDPPRIEPPTNKCIIKNKYSGLSSSNRNVRFGVNHSFRLIDCEDESWYPFHCLLPDPQILSAINGRYSLEVKKAVLSSLRWVHRCHHPESRVIRSPVHEPKFDCSEYIDEYDRLGFQKHIEKFIHARLHKVIFETEYSAETKNEIEFVIDVFDTSEKECWKIILKRKTDLKESGKFKVGDVVSLTLFTKSRKLSGKWKETINFGYVEELDVVVKDDHQIQKISLFVHPILHEVKRDQVKIQTVLNIGHHLKLLTALAVIPYSEVVDLFTISSIKELKSDAEFIESEQSHAANLCYEGIFSEHPFLYIVDGAPGTGKSNFIVRLVQKLYSKEELDYFLKILIVTQSRASGDEILRRLVKSQSQSSTNFKLLRYGDVKTIHPSLRKYVLDDSNYILEEQNLSFDVDLEKRILEAKKNVQKEQDASVIDEPAEASALRKRYVEEILIGSAHVVIVSQDACYDENFLKHFTPCASKNGIFNKFTVCIFDDANEMSETDLLIPVMTMTSKLILIGDSRNPTKDDESLTPFSQLLQKYQKRFPKNTINFQTQFRVHPKIIDCLSKMNLNVNSSTENMESKLALKPLMVIDLPSEEESLDHSKNFEAQAKFCKSIIQNMRTIKDLGNLRVGVMVGTKKQKHIVEEELKSCSPDILVDKVAGYCGLEKDVIIVCVPTLLFLDKFWYTSMTRAKRSVIICGDFSRYKGQEKIDQLLSNAKRRKCFQRWEKDPSAFPFRLMRLFLNKNNEVTPS